MSLSGFDPLRGDLLAHRALIAAIRAGESVPFRVRGSSMWPFVRSGTRVRVEPRAVDTLRPGDLVAYERDARIVVHRLVERDADAFVCRGDAIGGAAERVERRFVLGAVVVLESEPLRWKLPRARHVTAVARAVVRWTGANLRGLLARAGAR